MTDNINSSGTTHDGPEQSPLTGQIEQAGAVRKPKAQAHTVSNPQPLPITVKGQKYIAPAGRHSQQSHRRARERSAAQGFATIQEQHAHDRSIVKAEISKLAAQKATQKPNPPK